MRGDSTTENEGEADDNPEIAATSGERRPSVVTLQNMLKKVSNSPFQNHQYKTLDLPSSDSSGSFTNGSRNKQDGERLINLSAAAPDNHQIHLGQESDSKELNPDDIFLPPPAFKSSPLDFQPDMKTVGNGAVFTEPQKDLFQALSANRLQGHFQTSTLAQNASSNGHFHDVTLSSPDLFKPIPAQAQNHSNPFHDKSSDLFKDDGVNLFQAAKGEDFLHAERTREVNLFDTSPSTVVDPFKSLLDGDEDDRPWSPPPMMTNSFYTTTSKEADLFHAVPTKSEELSHNSDNQYDPSSKVDLFGMSDKENLDIFSPKSFDPFPSPITRNLFQDVSSLDDPFGTTPSKRYNPFQDVSNGTPDIFQKLPSKSNSKDTFEGTPSHAASTPLLNGSSGMMLDWLTSPDPFQAKPSESYLDIQQNSSNRPNDIVLTTPQGTKHDIFQPTPFSRARNLSMTPSQAQAQMTHGSTFKRPPRPLPRKRPPKKEKPPTPGNLVGPEPTVPKTSPKPVCQDKPKTLESKPRDPEDHVVFADILLTGQERCVEDWPEDSPELNPNFKPSGTLRLRRESMNKKGDSDGGSGEDQDGSGSRSKKKDNKLKIPSRRGSKERFSDDNKEGRSMTLPIARKSSKEFSFPEAHMSAAEKEDMEHSMDYKKKHLKAKVNQLLRRASTNSFMPDAKQKNGHLPQESKGDDLNKKSSKKNSIIRRWSEGTVLDESTGEEEGGEAQHKVDNHGFKTKSKVKVKFVPRRGFAITKQKTEDEAKGAHGYTPRKGSMEKWQDEVLGAHGYTPQKKPQADAYEDVEELKGHSLHSTRKAAFTDDEHLEDEDPNRFKDSKPKKTTKKLLNIVRRSSKEDMLGDTSLQKKKGSFSADELDEPERNGMEDCKPKKFKHKAPVPIPRKKTANGQSEPIGFSYHIPQQASNQDVFAEGDITQAGKYFMSTEDMYDSEVDEKENCKSKKPSKLKKNNAKSKAMKLEFEDAPGATSSDFLSEAARAEWLAARMDEWDIEGLEDEEQDGDTDSLMEWWYTVEQWDEVPSDDENQVIKEDECKSFTILANKVHRGLHLFNKVFTERAEVLWHSVIYLHAIADNISAFHQKAKIAGITGGTTTAVGGVTAIAGLALAPFTFGASLIVTAVGVGVAAAGGIASASAAISDNVNNMQDQKKMEMVLQEYESHLQDIGKILHFVNQGLYKLRGHPFLRSGTQHYAQDWEIRKAVQMISLVDSPVMRGTEITDAAIASVQGLFKGMDKFFIKDSRELKKGCKKEVVAQIKEVANVLNDGVVELNAIREELQDATGDV